MKGWYILYIVTKKTAAHLSCKGGSGSGDCVRSSSGSGCRL